MSLRYSTAVKRKINAAALEGHPRPSLDAGVRFPNLRDVRWGIRCVLLLGAFLLLFPANAAAFGPLGSFGEFGDGPGELDSPAQLAVAPDGELYVADAGNDRISVFAGNGTFRRTFGEGKLLEPQDVALADDGRAFVADAGHDRIAVFGDGGEFLTAFGETTLSEPSGIDVDAAVLGATVFVADKGNDRIAAFSSAGSALPSIEALTSPRDVIVAGGDLYVANFGKEEVDVFSKEGAFIRSFGGTGSGQGELNGPVALAQEDAGGVYVADETAERIVRFDAAGSFLDVAPAVPNVAGVGLACGGNVFATERATLLARVQRFGEPVTPVPPCITPPGEPIKVELIQVPSNRFRFAGLLKNRRNGSAVLFVRVPGPGKVILKGRGVRRLARGASRAMRVRLPIKPKVRLRHFLKRHGKGRIRVEVTFKPVGGTPNSLERPILLKRKRR
jgi:NHL repeat